MGVSIHFESERMELDKHVSWTFPFGSREQQQCKIDELGEADALCSPVPERICDATSTVTHAASTAGGAMRELT
jgi:hypothetical protein